MTTTREYRCEICGIVATHPIHWFIIQCGDTQLTVLRWLLAAGQKVLLLDVRQPLDLLAHLEIIPGAKRIVPKVQLLENSTLMPKDEDSIVYCTCPGQKTSLQILRRALARGYSRVKFLKGGLTAWKANGYPVEPYQEVFHLNDARAAQHSG